MSKVPQVLPRSDAAEISSRVQGYFHDLEEERGDLRRERELLQTQNRDLERSLALAESRAERAEQERDQARDQRTDALEKLVAMTTLWTTIENAVAQGKAMVARTAGSLRQSMTDPAPRKNGPPSRPFEEISADLASLARKFNHDAGSAQQPVGKPAASPGSAGSTDDQGDGH